MSRHRTSCPRKVERTLRIGFGVKRASHGQIKRPQRRACPAPLSGGHAIPLQPLAAFRHIRYVHAKSILPSPRSVHAPETVILIMTKAAGSKSKSPNRDRNPLPFLDFDTDPDFDVDGGMPIGGSGLAAVAPREGGRPRPTSQARAESQRRPRAPLPASRSPLTSYTRFENTILDTQSHNRNNSVASITGCFPRKLFILLICKFLLISSFLWHAGCYMMGTSGYLGRTPPGLAWKLKERDP
jgi:hypothetical protein